MKKLKIFESSEISLENKLENLLNSGKRGSVNDYIGDMKIRVEATLNPMTNAYDRWVVDVTKNGKTESFTETVNDKGGIENLMASVSYVDL